MTQLRRLLDDGTTPDEALSLLRSMSPPVAPDAAQQAELAHQLTSLVAPPPATFSPSNAWRFKAAALASGVGLAAVWLAMGTRPTPAGTVVPKPSPSFVATPPSASVSEPILRATPLDASPTPVNGAASAPPPLKSKLSRRDSLAEEEALLEQARRQAASSPAQARALLEQHRRHFPAGQLSAERMFLNFDVLTRLGKMAAARRQGDELIRAFPGSVYAAQVKARTGSLQ